VSEVHQLGGVRVLICAEAGAPVEAADLIGDALGQGADLVAVPLARLAPGFLDLKTRIAGEMLQKFVNYRRRIALVGDVSGAVAASEALRDFVRESNRGRHVWFVADLAELESRLSA
jgi:hypothetical protein